MNRFLSSVFLTAAAVCAYPQQQPPRPPAGIPAGIPVGGGTSFPKGETSADEKAEMFKPTNVEKFENYEVRTYPASTWACVSGDFSDWKDPMDNWQQVYENNPFAAMSSSRFEDNKSNDMFMELFKYIVGVNSEGTEIEMTRPVTTKWMAAEKKREMCFWTGSPWAGKDVPKPLKKNVYIQERPEMTVYVRRFDGFAMSDADWQSEHEALRSNLVEMNDVESDVFYTAGYNSPWTAVDRINEIWITKEDPKVEKDEEDSEEDELETAPYTVIKTFDDYELRHYASQQWVCTETKAYDYENDAYADWQERFEGNFWAAMSGTRGQRKKQPVNKMFRKLYAYIVGLNADGEEIEMSKPVTKRHGVIEGKTEDVEMCFWTGSPWEGKDAPEPIKKDVYIQKRDDLYVYVRRFDGFALSYDDWHKEHVKLVESLKDTKYVKDVYYTAGYDHYKMDDRRNEVWLPVERNDIQDVVAAAN